MAVKQTERQTIDLYPESSYFKNIVRVDGMPWSDDIKCKYKVFDNLNTLVDEGESLKSIDTLAFELRYKNTADWSRKMVYTMIVSIEDIVTGYKDVVLETTINVQ